HTSFQHYSEYYGLGLLQRPAVAWLRWFHNQSLLTLTASSTQQRELARMGINNLMLLGRGVDCDLFHPRRRDPALRAHWGAGKDDLVLLHVGRLTAEKNLALLERSREAMSNSTVRLRLVVVGDGPLRAS